MLPDLLHGEERKVWGDGGYQGQTEAIWQAAPQAQDMTCRRTKFKNYVDELQKKKNTSKSRVRAKVEACLRLRHGTLPGHREEPSPPMCLLRPGLPLSSPQTPGRTRAPVRLNTA
jgi:IS5 family transposase